MGKKLKRTPSLETTFLAITIALQNNGNLNSLKINKHPLPIKMNVKLKKEVL
jgi:hypothetical protein